MSIPTSLILLGLTFNTLGSLVMLCPYLNIKRDVEDDFIVKMDSKTGEHTRKKHLKGRKLGILGFSLFSIGFVLQIIGVYLGAI